MPENKKRRGRPPSKSKQKAKATSSSTKKDRLDKWLESKRNPVQQEVVPEYPTEQLLCAKEYYFRGVPCEQIAKMLDMKEWYLRRQIEGWKNTPGWKIERVKFYEGAWQHIREAHTEDLKQTCGLTTEFIRKNVQRYLTQDIECTPRELKMFSDIVANLDRIVRLDMGTPTNIIGQMLEGKSLAALMDETKLAIENMAKRDPMAGEVFDAEYSEIKGDSESSNTDS